MENGYRIEKLGGEGMSITRIGGKVAFVPFGVPGDYVSLEIVREKKSFFEARIREILEPSPHRVEPVCRYFGSCGGCAHQNIAYPAQCHFKAGLLQEVFRAFEAHLVSWPELIPSPREFGYRNKLHLQLCPRKGRLAGGFYRFRSHRIVPIDRCPLYSEGVNHLFPLVVDLLNRLGFLARSGSRQPGPVKDLVIQENQLSGEVMLTLITSRRKLPGLKELEATLRRRFPRLGGCYQFYNPFPSDIAFKSAQEGPAPLNRLGGELLTRTLAGCRFRIAPPVFFQVNRWQTEQILQCLEEVFREAGEPGAGGLLDLYAGIGTLSLPLAGLFRAVLAVEFSPAAVRLAGENAALNRVEHFKILEGDAATFLAEQIKSCGKRQLAADYPCVLLDPPRGGLAPELRSLLAESDFPLIAYLSCNPHTQARDLAAICGAGRYRMTRMVPFDMFPHTFHIENLVVLQRV